MSANEEPQLDANGLPTYNDAWARLYDGTHFIVRGILYSNSKLAALVVALAEVVILEDNYKRYLTKTVVLRRNGCRFRDNFNESGVHTDWHKDVEELEIICKKFDKMWPLHFLAKEWPKELGHGLHNDHGAVV